MSGIFHSGVFDPPPMLSGKFPGYLFGLAIMMLEGCGRDRPFLFLQWFGDR